MSRFIETAKNNFFKREYKKALLNYSLALKDEPFDLDAKIGALLSDMAMDKEEEAMALFELYEVSKGEGIDGISHIIETLLHDDIEIITANEVDTIPVYEDGIEYKDFLNLIDNRESFKRALEDLMFSSRIVIHKKEDFIEFVKLLLENGYGNLALNYLESAISLYPYEIFFKNTLKQLEG